MPEVIRPNKTYPLTLVKKNGKEMTYCVAMVDEGLLDLTKFKTPDPHGAFYAREALGVRSFDLFNDVIGAWGGDLERILTIGVMPSPAAARQKGPTVSNPLSDTSVLLP